MNERFNDLLNDLGSSLLRFEKEGFKLKNLDLFTNMIRDYLNAQFVTNFVGDEYLCGDLLFEEVKTKNGFKAFYSWSLGECYNCELSMPGHKLSNGISEINKTIDFISAELDKSIVSYKIVNSAPKPREGCIVYPGGFELLIDFEHKKLLFSGRVMNACINNDKVLAETTLILKPLIAEFNKAGYNNDSSWYKIHN